MCWCSEVLSFNIRANPCITGLSIPWSQMPLSPVSQYADDTSLIVNSDDAILAVFDTYSWFEAASGSKLNVSKSKGLWNNRRDPPVQLKWTSEKIKVLVGPGDHESQLLRIFSHHGDSVLCRFGAGPYLLAPWPFPGFVMLHPLSIFLCGSMLS